MVASGPATKAIQLLVFRVAHFSANRGNTTGPWTGDADGERVADGGFRRSHSLSLSLARSLSLSLSLARSRSF